MNVKPLTIACKCATVHVPYGTQLQVIKMSTNLIGKNTQFREACHAYLVQERTDGSPKEPLAILTELKALNIVVPADYGIANDVGESIIEGMFTRVTTASGAKRAYGPELATHNVRFQNTPPGRPSILGGITSIPAQGEQTLMSMEPTAPDFESAASLTKSELDDYALTFGINLNQSNTKENMLIDFETQWSQL